MRLSLSPAQRPKSPFERLTEGAHVRIIEIDGWHFSCYVVDKEDETSYNVKRGKGALKSYLAAGSPGLCDDGEIVVFKDLVPEKFVDYVALHEHVEAHVSNGNHAFACLAGYHALLKLSDTDIAEYAAWLLRLPQWKQHFERAIPGFLNAYTIQNPGPLDGVNLIKLFYQQLLLIESLQNDAVINTYIDGLREKSNSVFNRHYEVMLGGPRAVPEPTPVARAIEALHLKNCGRIPDRHLLEVRKEVARIFGLPVPLDVMSEEVTPESPPSEMRTMKIDEITEALSSQRIDVRKRIEKHIEQLERINAVPNNDVPGYREKFEEILCHPDELAYVRASDRCILFIDDMTDREFFESCEALTGYDKWRFGLRPKKSDKKMPSNYQPKAHDFELKSTKQPRQPTGAARITFTPHIRDYRGYKSIPQNYAGRYLAPREWGAILLEDYATVIGELGDTEVDKETFWSNSDYLSHFFDAQDHSTLFADYLIPLRVREDRARRRSSMRKAELPLKLSSATQFGHPTSPIQRMARG